MKTSGLNFKSAVPLYYQLKEKLKNQITSMTWKPEQLLPTENELATLYNVSVGTVKKAMSELVAEGILYRKQGKGTFVTRPELDKTFLNYFENAIDEYKSPLPLKTQMLSMEVIQPDQSISEILKLKNGEAVFSWKQTLSHSGQGVFLEYLFLSRNLFAGFDKLYLENQNRYYLYETHYSLPFIWAKETIRVKSANREIAKHLSIKERSPVIYIERIVHSYQNQPIEYIQFIGSGEYFSFSQEIH